MDIIAPGTNVMSNLSYYNFTNIAASNTFSQIFQINKVGVWFIRIFTNLSAITNIARDYILIQNGVLNIMTVFSGKDYCNIPCNLNDDIGKLTTGANIAWGYLGACVCKIGYYHSLKYNHCYRQCNLNINQFTSDIYTG